MKPMRAVKLIALTNLLAGLGFYAFAAGPVEYFDVNGATTGFGTPSPTGIYDLAGTTFATTTLTTGFANGAAVTSVSVTSVNNIFLGTTMTGTGVPAGVQVSGFGGGNTVIVTAFVSTAASSGNYAFGYPLAWSASSLGTAATTAFTSGATMEFTGVTGVFAVNLDAADVLAGVVVNSPNINVVLAGNADAHPSGSSTWSVVANSALTEANSFESAGGMDFNNASMTLSGGGTIAFLTPIGENSSSALWTESMTGIGAVNFEWTNSSPSSFAGSYTLTSGTLNFGTGAACSNAFTGFSFATSQFKINGGVIDNTSGSAQTLYVGSGGFYSIGGNFIFKGSSSMTFAGANVDLTLTPTVSVLANTLTIGTGISGFAGDGLTKSGAGTLALTSASTYNGSTTIAAGTLALSGSGSIADSANILVGSGATFDVSGLTGTLAPGAGQTLTGEGATGTINGNLDLSAGSPLVLTNNGAAATLTITGGTLTLKNNAVTVDVTGSPLAANTYTLISPGSGGSVGGTVANSSVTVDGAGLAPDTQSSLQISTSGALQLVVSPAAAAAPSVVSIINNGDGTVTLNFLGSSGTKYVVQSTTDLGSPNWSNISTNTAGMDGIWNITQSMAGLPQLFFRAGFAQ